MSFIIRKEEKDHRAVEELTRDAFWNVFRPSIYLLLHR
ncbi:putative acetyltransferase [Streptococcus suis]|uniref:Putative acetyltransferase n=1 Tax=Streptococcus suis TaxID=1307 RepID=A0A0Z8FYY1_STRSU|nr:putative acetyltransferase [Streptococcus suis]CYU89210.1 putative acetyltransferase [Streptococcus suis]CYU99854.1 putative acetyltransferase [Streptococcus suis]CYV66405.1 putative acetyltransferase [Streptococcus suis]